MRAGIQVTGAVGGSLRHIRSLGQGKEAGVMEETDLICSTQAAAGYLLSLAWAGASVPDQRRALGGTSPMPPRSTCSHHPALETGTNGRITPEEQERRGGMQMSVKGQTAGEGERVPPPAPGKIINFR